MITTAAVVKTLLGITDTTYDARINVLLPMVEYDLLTYCNNQFLSDITFGGNIEIKVAGAVYTLECDDGGFSDSGFSIDDIIYLRGSVRNDGYLTIFGLSDTILTISEKLYSEDEQALTLTFADFPVELPMYIAQMIWHKIDHIKDAGLTGETIKSYSYTRADSGAMGYPAEVLRGLDKWRNIRVVKGQRREQYNERRGSWVGAKITGPCLGSV